MNSSFQALKLYFANVQSGFDAPVESQPTAATPKKKKALKCTPKVECLGWLLGFINGVDTPTFLQRALLTVLSEVKNKVRLMPVIYHIFFLDFRI